MQNPQLALNQMLLNNPQLKQAFDYIQQNGGDPQQAAMNYAHQLGLDPQQVINEIKESLQ